MKIALITIHRANNYGAVLQAFASQEVLSRYGEVSVIDHRNGLAEETMAVLRFAPRLRNVLSVGKDMMRILPRYRAIKKFKQFIDGRFKLVGGEKNGRTGSLSDLEAGFDVFVAGSDQIWNPRAAGIANRFDPAYFLQFVKNKKKISYASSAGDFKFDARQEKQLTTMLGSFHRLSVREKDTASFLSGLLGRDIPHVLDPTLLMSKEQWRDALTSSVASDPEKYLLVYALRKDALLCAAVTCVSRRLNLKVIAVDQDPFLAFRADRHMKEAGPSDFLKLFFDASFVVTNSFHGVAFALNFEKPFIATRPPTGANRIQSVLTAVGVSERMIENAGQVEKLLSLDGKLAAAPQRLRMERKSSLEYLESALIN